MGVTFVRHGKRKLTMPERTTKVILPFSETILKEELAGWKVTDVYEKGLLYTKHYPAEDVLKVVEKFTSDKTKREIYIRNPFAQNCMQELITYYVGTVKESGKEKQIDIDKKIKSEEVPLIPKGGFEEFADHENASTRDIQVKKLTLEVQKK